MELYTSLKDNNISWTDKGIICESYLSDSNICNRYQLAADIFCNAIAPKCKTSVSTESGDYCIIWGALAKVVQQAPNEAIKFKPSIVQSILKGFDMQNLDILPDIFQILQYILDDKNGQPELIRQNYENLMKLLLCCFQLDFQNFLISISDRYIDLIIDLVDTTTGICSTKSNSKALLILICKDYLKISLKFVYKLKNTNLQKSVLEFLKINLFRKNLGDLYGIALTSIGAPTAPVTIKLFDTIEQISKNSEDEKYLSFVLRTISTLFIQAYPTRKDMISFVLHVSSLMSDKCNMIIFLTTTQICHQFQLYKPSLDPTGQQFKYFLEKFETLMSESQDMDLVLQCATHLLCLDSRFVSAKLTYLVKSALLHPEPFGAPLLCCGVEVYSRQRQLDVFMQVLVESITLPHQFYIPPSLRDAFYKFFPGMPLGQVTQLASNIMQAIKSCEFDSIPCLNLSVVLHDVVHSVNISKCNKLSQMLKTETHQVVQEMRDTKPKRKLAHCLLSKCIQSCILVESSYSLKNDIQSECESLLSTMKPCSNGLCKLTSFITHITIFGSGQECLKIPSINVENVSYEYEIFWDFFLQVAWPAIINHSNLENLNEIAIIFSENILENSILNNFFQKNIIWESLKMRKMMIDAIYKATENFWIKISPDIPNLHKSVCKSLRKIERIEFRDIADQFEWRRLILKGVKRLSSDGPSKCDKTSIEKLQNLYDLVPFEYLESELKYGFGACVILTNAACKTYFNVNHNTNLIKIIASDPEVAPSFQNVQIGSIWNWCSLYFEDYSILEAIFDALILIGCEKSIESLNSHIFTYISQVTSVNTKLQLVKLILDKGGTSVLMPSDMILFQLMHNEAQGHKQNITESIFDAVSALYKNKLRDKDQGFLRMDMVLPNLVSKASQLGAEYSPAVRFLCDTKAVRVRAPVLHCVHQSIQPLFVSTNQRPLNTLAQLLFAAPIWVVKDMIKTGNWDFGGELSFWRSVLFYCKGNCVGEGWTEIIKTHLPPFLVKMAGNSTDSSSCVVHSIQFYQLLIQNPCRKLMDDRLQNVLGLAFAAVATIQWSSLNNSAEFKLVFTCACQILNDSLIQYAGVTVNMAATFISILSGLVNQLCKYSNRNDRDSVTVSQCCYSLYKMCVLIGQNKRDFERIVPYLLSQFLNATFVGNLSSKQKKLILNGIYKLLDMCDKYSIALLSTNMSPTLLALFKVTYQDYQKFHKYKGYV